MAELALSSTLASGGLPPPPGVLASLEAERFYHDAMACLAAEGIPFLLGGAYALYHHTGIRRWTKDLDLFVAPDVCEPVLACLARAGYRSELTDRRWLGKAFSGAHLVDVIFSSGNQVATVDARGIVRMKPVAIARDLGVTLEISSGLATTDRVIKTPWQSIHDGLEVKIKGKTREADAR